MTLRERFRRFLKRWLYQEIQGWLADFKADVADQLRSAVEDHSLVAKRLEAQTNGIHHGVVCSSRDVASALSKHQEELALQAAAVAVAVQNLERRVADLSVITGTTFREFEAVDYAVDKLEHDKELHDSLDEDGRIRECANWAGKYCSQNGWDTLPEFKLRELIVLKRRLNADRRVGRHG